jgi:superfamily II DNA or RNA helicase
MAHLEGDSCNLWLTISGELAELKAIARALDAWTEGLGKGKGGCPVYLWEGKDRLAILGGALPVALGAEAVGRLGVPSGETAFVVRANARRLASAGLLRDYQADAVCAALMAPGGRAVVDMVMGGGKTHVSAGLAAAAGGRWLYLVQNKELAAQSERAFGEALDAMNAVCTDVEEVGSLVATTYAGIKKLGSCVYDGVIVDECHGISAPTRAVAYAAVKAFWRVGLSGTPLDRQDTKNGLVLAMLGPVAYRIGLEQLTADGYLSSGTVRVARYQPGRGLILV